MQDIGIYSTEIRPVLFTTPNFPHIAKIAYYTLRVQNTRHCISPRETTSNDMSKLQNDLDFE
jgi:hypothetical protein